jgi:nitroreductase
MNTQKLAIPDYPVHSLIAQRWSPYSFADRDVSMADLRSVFEAARWAASSYNEQPWQYIVAVRSHHGEFQTMLSCLVESNQRWASAAPVLAIGCTSLNFSRNGQPNAAALHDLGLASANLTFEATSRGLFVHQMMGILPDKVRELYQVPEGIRPATALAIGYATEPESIPEAFQGQDLTARRRKPVSQFVFSGQWGAAAKMTE